MHLHREQFLERLAIALRDAAAECAELENHVAKLISGFSDRDLPTGLAVLQAVDTIRQIAEDTAVAAEWAADRSEELDIAELASVLRIERVRGTLCVEMRDHHAGQTSGDIALL